jgi:hypothetical protein
VLLLRRCNAIDSVRKQDIDDDVKILCRGHSQCMRCPGIATYVLVRSVRLADNEDPSRVSNRVVFYSRSRKQSVFCMFLLIILWRALPSCCSPGCARSRHLRRTQLTLF